jgi:hypothetical protein
LLFCVCDYDFDYDFDFAGTMDVTKRSVMLLLQLLVVQAGCMAMKVAVPSRPAALWQLLLQQ